MEPYLSRVHKIKYRTYLTRFRISAHDLAIERGRYVNIDRINSIYKCCNINVIENKYHFLLVCPAYSDLHKSYFNSYYSHWPNMLKCVNLMTSTTSYFVNNRFVYMSLERWTTLLDL
jgi:hypothetical protein